MTATDFNSDLLLLVRLINNALSTGQKIGQEELPVLERVLDHDCVTCDTAVINDAEALRIYLNSSDTPCLHLPKTIFSDRIAEMVFKVPKTERCRLASARRRKQQRQGFSGVLSTASLILLLIFAIAPPLPSQDLLVFSAKAEATDSGSARELSRNKANSELHKTLAAELLRCGGKPDTAFYPAFGSVDSHIVSKRKRIYTAETIMRIDLRYLAALFESLDTGKKANKDCLNQSRPKQLAKQ